MLAAMLLLSGASAACVVSAAAAAFPCLWNPGVHNGLHRSWIQPLLSNSVVRSLFKDPLVEQSRFIICSLVQVSC